jgi:uncharacterized membrane protein YphA (DoxX/SURF4 family)
MNAWRWLTRGATVLLTLTFLAAAWPKLVDPPGFRQTLFHYALLPEGALVPLALTLPWVELVAALALLLPRLRRSAALVLLVLLLAFSGALALNLARGRVVDCGCFGAAQGPRTEAEKRRDMTWDLARDLVLAVLALALVLPPRAADPEAAP